MKISLSQTAVYNKVNHEIYRHFTKVCFVKFWFCWLWFTSARGDVFNSLLVVQCLVEINVVVVEKKIILSNTLDQNWEFIWSKVNFKPDWWRVTSDQKIQLG